MVAPMSITPRQPIFPVTEVNHVAMRVSDVARSREFYVEMFGASVVAEMNGACFMELPNQDFIALFPTDTPHMEHFCLTLPDYDPDAVAAELDDRGVPYRRREDRVFIEDPDGLLVQLSGPNGTEFAGG